MGAAGYCKVRNVATVSNLVLRFPSSSCAYQNIASEISSTEWTPLWRAGSRSLTFSTTSRAAALQLHAIVAKNLVQYHDIGEDIETIVVSADASGPAILSDSGLFLMTHLLHARVTEVPGASLAASQHVIRWLFARWDPGMSLPFEPSYSPY
jgi:ataxia telangiectasia mutated family protein